MYATDDLIKKLRLEITQLKDENDSLKRAQGGRGQNLSGGNGGGYNGNGGKSNKRGGGERGRGGPNNNAGGDDEKFLAQRNLVCMGYNRNITCRDTPCQLEHKCIRKIGEGKICQEKHRGKIDGQRRRMERFSVKC